MKPSLFAAMLLAVPALAAFAAEPPSAARFYVSKCAACHGKDGRGGAKMAKLLKVEAKDLDLLDEKRTDAIDARFVKAVLEGKGKKMPGYKAKLEGLEPAALVAHVRTLKPSKVEGEAKP
jgi:mono/diheme cytochrome c family protein